MKEYGVELSKKEIQLENKSLENKKISQTGNLNTMNRREFSDYVEKRGGEFSSNVTKTTDILVVGDNPGSKLQKAEKYGVKILKENDFFTQYK
jgi:DNA ligase (NAD+)